MGSYNQALKETAMQLIISICALAAAAYASDPYAPPAPYHPAPAPYHPPPVPYHPPAPAPYHPAPAPYHEEAPKNYQFGYDVHGYDEYGNPNVHSRTEARDGYNVKGQYRVELPDCRTQIVDYFVDEYKQYHADVKYEGVPCPDKSLLKHAPLVGHPVAHHAPVVAHPVAHHAPVVAHPVAHHAVAHPAAVVAHHAAAAPLVAHPAAVVPHGAFVHHA